MDFATVVAIPLVSAGITLAGVIAPYAQTGSEAEKQRGSIPPGTSRDGSRPADGAIKGGAITPTDDAKTTPRVEKKRCDQLTGTLREDCLKDVAENKKQ